MANLPQNNLRWQKFLTDLGSSPDLDIVGPLTGAKYPPQRPTIYVDGGTEFLLPGTFPTLTVGDGDSTTRTLDVVLPRDKAYSDLAFVLHHLPESIREVNLLGFLGGRRDHELIGLGEAHHFLRRQSQLTQLHFGQEVHAFTCGSVTLTLHGVFSVVAFEPTDITLTGACRYTLEPSHPLPLISSLGLSNEGHGEVTLHSRLPLFVFSSL